MFRIVDEREKHIKNLYEAGDFIGDYLKPQTFVKKGDSATQKDFDVSSAKSEYFGGSVHDQSQG